MYLYLLTQKAMEWEDIEIYTTEKDATTRLMDIFDSYLSMDRYIEQNFRIEILKKNEITNGYVPTYNYLYINKERNVLYKDSNEDMN